MSMFIRSVCQNNWYKFLRNNSLCRDTKQRSKRLVYCCQRPYCSKIIEPVSSSTEKAVSNFDDIADYLSVEKEVLSEALKKEPNLLNVHPIFWKNSLEALKTSGFSGRECINMIIMSPSLLKVKPELIMMGMKNWQRTDLGDYKLLSLLTSCPQLLFVEAHEISKRYPVLKTLSTKKSIVELLRSYPHFMLVDWNNFLEKLKYVEEEMKINRNQIFKCDILRCSLFELMVRHRFLERLGKYTPPDPKAEQHLPNKNPTLRQIVDSDDLSFATKFGGVTLEEFEVFRELFRNEINEIYTDLK